MTKTAQFQQTKNEQPPIRHPCGTLGKNSVK